MPAPTHHVLHHPLSDQDLVGRLVQAIGRHQHEQIAPLIAAGADVNGMTASGTPLHMAVFAQNIPAIEALVTHGVDLNAPGQAWEDGESHRPAPLVYAMRSARVEVVRRLLDLGADPAVVDSWGISLLSLATTRSRGAEGAVKAVVDAFAKAGRTPDATEWARLVADQVTRGSYKTVAALLNLTGVTLTAESRDRIEYALNENCPPPDRKKIRALLDRAYVRLEQQALNDVMHRVNESDVATPVARRRL